MSGLAERVRALADEWFDEDDGIAHVAACQDYGCKDCVVIACATDLRALLAEDETPASSDDTEALAAELGCEYHSDGYGVCASCHEQAEQVMDSEWLTNYLAEAWDQGYNNGFYDRDLMRTDEARDATEGRSQNPYRQPDTT